MISKFEVTLRDRFLVLQRQLPKLVGGACEVEDECIEDQDEEEDEYYFDGDDDDDDDNDDYGSDVDVKLSIAIRDDGENEEAEEAYWDDDGNCHADRHEEWRKRTTTKVACHDDDDDGYELR